MSGGHFDYSQFHIEQIADEIDNLIANNGSNETDEWGYLKYQAFPPEILDQFKQAANALRRAYVYAQRVDWLVSGDDGEESFIKRLAADLAKLTPYEQE